MPHFVSVPPDKQFWVPSLRQLGIVPGVPAEVAVWGMPDDSQVRAKANPRFVAQERRKDANLRYYHLTGLSIGDEIAAFLPGGAQYTAWLPIKHAGLSTIRIPPIIKQVASNHCWAAALYSWMQATGRKPIPNTPIRGYKDLVDRYADSENDGISRQQFSGAVARAFNLTPYYVTDGRTVLSETFVDRFLMIKNAPILFVFNSGIGISHTVVVYGATKQSVKCMDPSDGAHVDHPFTMFNNGPWMILYSK